MYFLAATPSRKGHKKVNFATRFLWSVFVKKKKHFYLFLTDINLFLTIDIKETT